MAVGSWLPCPSCDEDYCRETFRCNVCGKSFYTGTCAYCWTNVYSAYSLHAEEKCSVCEGKGQVQTNCIHGYANSHTYKVSCTTCNGVGTITSSPCIHGYSSSHRYCSHYTNTTLTSHQYCSHGRTSQHD